MENISNLELALRNSWNRETSADPKNWSEKNPSFGQCAVTALVVQDYLGGDIVNSLVDLGNQKTESHYFNLINGQEVDLTREQFPIGTHVPPGQPKTKDFKTTRDYVLSYEPTQKRYEILKDNVQKFLEDFT